ncbi:hypothetical protein NDU88_001507 [Pleurodeles waltl]|uniref:Uncharacterized protein n=1 Tax=Pleurodeles waltl TaxID=8319 RepID=A0AAV7L9Y3_PLEWA|nr:hypothetical protein NDU88_001507 [Pleurodeles waltl]
MPRLKAARKEELGVPLGHSMVLERAPLYGFANRVPTTAMGETRIESRRARVATKRLQGTVRKVAKSCTEIEAKLGTMDERIVAVEEDVNMLKQQNAMQEGQLTDIMWKLEEFEKPTEKK